MNTIRVFCRNRKIKRVRRDIPLVFDVKHRPEQARIPANQFRRRKGGVESHVVQAGRESRDFRFNFSASFGHFDG